MKFMTRTEQVLIILSLSMIVFFGLNVVSWIYFPKEIFTVENPMKIKVDKTVYNAGDRLYYHYNYCKTKPLSAEVVRNISDGVSIPFDKSEIALPTGCHTFNTSVVIPEFLSSDTYHIEIIDTTRKINPLTDEIDNLRTVDFQVINKSNDATQLENHEQQDLEKFNQLFQKVK